MTGRVISVEYTKRFEIVSGMRVETYLGDAPVDLDVIEVYDDKVVFSILGKRYELSLVDFATRIADEVGARESVVRIEE